jgi:hypothetical protein
MIMRARNDDDRHEELTDKQQRPPESTATDACLYRYVPVDPSWRRLRIDDAQSDLSGPRGLQTPGQDDSELPLINSTLYLG